MKKTYVNVAADSGAVTASQESSGVLKHRLLTVNDTAARLQSKLKTVYYWVQERYIPSIKRRAQIRADQSGSAAWVKKRERVGRIYKRVKAGIS